jgi:hypothetical protein
VTNLSRRHRQIEALPTANLRPDALQPVLGRTLHQNVVVKLQEYAPLFGYCCFQVRGPRATLFFLFSWIHAANNIRLVLGISDSSHARPSETFQRRRDPPSAQQGEDEQSSYRRRILRHRIRI